MVTTTDIEKKSLETHVELCAERYKFLEEKLENVEQKVTQTETVIREVHDMMQRMADKRTDQIISWGIGIIGFLLASLGWMITTYVIK
jgi:chromosome segregation ATPase